MAHYGLTGVLLVGGASSRFGSSKALARFDGETLAERAWRTLGGVCDERLAVGKVADGVELPFAVLDDGTDIRAPIAGVVAGLRAATHPVCVVLTVDCPLASADALRRLAAAAPARPQTGPLPAAYTRAQLPELERKLDSAITRCATSRRRWSSSTSASSRTSTPRPTYSASSCVEKNDVIAS